MKRTFLLFTIAFCIFTVSCSSSSGDDLPPLSEAPESSRLAAVCALQAIMEIAYDYEIGGVLTPNVTVSADGSTYTYSNAERDVTFDYRDYTVNLTGNAVSKSESVMVINLTVVRCVAASGTYFCTLNMETKNNKVTKVVLDGKEYDPD